MPSKSRPKNTLSQAPRRNSRLRRGYTLMELMISVSLLSLLLLGVIGIFNLMLGLSGSVLASMTSSQDASNAIQRISSDLREANSFVLLDDAVHDATDSQGNTLVTGITITSPNPWKSTITYTSGAGVSKALTAANNPYDLAAKPDTTASVVTFYRANWQQAEGADGTPNPNTGKCLWVTGMENGQAVIPGPVIKTIAPTPDAVQFIIPRLADGVTPVVNEAEIKIISGQYDPIHGTATSDSSAGSSTALTGECVYLRDHNPSPIVPGGTNGKRLYFGG